MSKNFEILNKEINENNIIANLFIFPFAGGGVSAFRKWKDEFEDIKLLVAQYPGRENRFSEKAISDINILVDNLFEIKPGDKRVKIKITFFIALFMVLKTFIVKHWLKDEKQ